MDSNYIQGKCLMMPSPKILLKNLNNQIERRNFLVMSVALLAIGFFVTGVTTFVLNQMQIFETTAAFSFEMFGASAVLTASTYGLYRVFKKDKIIESHTITVYSHNVGAWRDTGNMIQLNNLMNQSNDYREAWSKFDYNSNNNTARRNFSPELIQNKIEQLNASITSCNPDIICLQEVDLTFDPQYLNEAEIKTILPAKYAFTTCRGKDDITDSIIAWDRVRFELIYSAKIDYSQLGIVRMQKPPTSMILLKERNSNKTICVGSAHHFGFDLSQTEDLEDREAAKQLGRDGDLQLDEDLTTMNAANIEDVCIYAGDFNVTKEAYPERLEKLQAQGFVADSSDTAPTIFDAHLKEEDGKTPRGVKLDFIFARGVTSIFTQAVGSLYNFNRPSDHLPLFATIRLPIKS